MNISTPRVIAILAAVLALFFGTPARAQEPLLHTDDLTVNLLFASAGTGEAALTLQWISRAQEETVLQLFAPLINGEPAAFQYGWPSKEVRLAPGSETETVITLYADDPSTQAQTAALRFIRAGAVSSEGVIDLTSGSIQAPASLAPGAETPLVESVVAWDAPASPLLLEDTLTPEQTALLDYGQLQVCLRRTVDGREELIPFAVVPASVTPEGRVSAAFSGLAAVCSAAPDFPLPTKETQADGAATLAVHDITLSGPFIFYSTLSFSLTADPQAQSAAMTGLALDSADAGCILHAPPLCLFDTLSLSLPVYQAAPQDGAITLASVDVLFASLPVESPLSFRIVPAASLGDIVAYFEYFFLDRTDVIHPLIPLT